jgi:hypothetical protein
MRYRVARCDPADYFCASALLDLSIVRRSVTDEFSRSV